MEDASPVLSAIDYRHCCLSPLLLLAKLFTSSRSSRLLIGLKFHFTQRWIRVRIFNFGRKETCDIYSKTDERLTLSNAPNRHKYIYIGRNPAVKSDHLFPSLWIVEINYLGEPQSRWNVRTLEPITPRALKIQWKDVGHFSNRVASDLIGRGVSTTRSTARICNYVSLIPLDATTQTRFYRTSGPAYLSIELVKELGRQTAHKGASNKTAVLLPPLLSTHSKPLETDR